MHFICVDVEGTGGITQFFFFLYSRSLKKLLTSALINDARLTENKMNTIDLKKHLIFIENKA